MDPHDRIVLAFEREAIRRGWLIPREPIRYEDVPQRFPRDPSIVTFKDWLDSRSS